MANTTIYPFGTEGQLPSDIGIVNDLTTGGVNKALSAEMGKELGVRTTMRKQIPCYALWTKGAYYNWHGELVSSNSYCYVLLNLEGIVHLNIADAHESRIVYFGSDGTTLVGTTSTEDVYVFPEGAVYAGISYQDGKTQNITIDYEMPVLTNEVENGDFKYKKLTYPTGNWTVLYSTGEQYYSTNWYGVFGFIPVMGADIIFCPQSDKVKGVICFYDENFGYISGFISCRAAKVPSTAKYAKIRCNSTDPSIAEVYLFEGDKNILDAISHIERDVMLLKPMPMNGKKVTFLGDSITDFGVGFGLYVKLFGERSGATVTSLAVAGKAYGDGEIASQASNLTGDEDVVVVMGGTNDHWRNFPIGDIYNEDNGVIVPTTNTATTCAGVHSVIQGIYEKCPLAKIIILTPPQKETGWNANTQGKYLYEYVDAIKKVAQLYGVLVVDQFANCNINPMFSAMKSKYFNNDGLHPNVLYHQLLADWLYNAIADWIREPFL